MENFDFDSDEAFQDFLQLVLSRVPEANSDQELRRKLTEKAKSFHFQKSLISQSPKEYQSLSEHQQAILQADNGQPLPRPRQRQETTTSSNDKQEMSNFNFLQMLLTDPGIDISQLPGFIPPKQIPNHVYDGQVKIVTDEIPPSKPWME